MFNKKIIIALLLLCVFAVGTLSFVDTVEAIKWKKYDSGTFKSEGMDFSYTTYIKGSNEIRMDISYKKVIITKNYFTKTKNGIRTVIKDSKGKTISENFDKTKISLKTFYKLFKKGLFSKK